MNKLSNGELVSRIFEGSKEAEERLLEKYRPRILKVARYNLSKARSNCEDLANEISIAVLTNLREGKFAGRSSLGTYVYSISRNMIAAYLRGEKPDRANIPENLPATALTREMELEKEQSAEVLERALEKLKPQYKKVLYLYYYEGLSVTETGQKLNIPPRRVSEKKSYALKKLKKLFNTS